MPDLTLDERYVYWSDLMPEEEGGPLDARIARVAKTGGATEVLGTAGREAVIGGLAVDATHVYFTFDQSVRVIPKPE